MRTHYCAPLSPRVQILRANLYGPTIRGYYPLTNNDLQLGKVGIYNPQQEEVYRCVILMTTRQQSKSERRQD